ncbi:carboxymuconolactone decarboxylase family protein [Nocardia acidivorans]|uniref:carboxymuconolactone decarboxylase family protein n=1 Tax=Nocardia acidivorans TaxID=404580 RepID=UPI000ABCF692|nr:carboxymuconolactone decarboxylase family protein [Nocardia acidivorans]
MRVCPAAMAFSTRCPATPETRYERGLAVLDQVGGPSGRAVLNGRADIAPDLGRYLIEFAFADAYSRPGLGLAERELATIAVCTTLGTAGPQLRVRLHGFLNVGGTREAIIQRGGYAGFPAALNAVGAAREVFAARE